MGDSDMRDGKQTRAPRKEDDSKGSAVKGSAADDGAAERRPAEPKARALSFALAAWLIPGAGHFLLDRKGRAAVFFLLVLLSAAIGLGLEGKLYRVVPGQPLTQLATLGAMGMGLPYFILRWGLGYHGGVQSAGYEYGTAFLLTAGLMNLMLVLDTWDIARGWKD